MILGKVLSVVICVLLLCISRKCRDVTYNSIGILLFITRNTGGVEASVVSPFTTEAFLNVNQLT